jgi:uncharacterized membrane protein YkgB
MEHIADRPLPLWSGIASERAPARAPELALLRLALALIFVWFGLPKLVPGLSPAEDLVRATIPWFDPAWFVPLLGATEAFIGLCLLRDRWLTLGLLLLAGHMVGAALPLVTLPDITWKAFPVATLEGQYVLKNAVLIAAAFAVASTHLRRPSTPAQRAPQERASL